MQPELWEDLEEDEWDSDGEAKSDDSNDENNPACDYPEDEEDPSDSDLGSDNVRRPRTFGRPMLGSF